MSQPSPETCFVLGDTLRGIEYIMPGCLFLDQYKKVSCRNFFAYLLSRDAYWLSFSDEENVPFRSRRDIEQYAIEMVLGI